MSTAHPLISFVVPVFNEADALPAFHASLIAAAGQASLDYEIVYCDDGSTDGSFKMLEDLHNEDACVHCVRLSRNFGKEAALAAGVAFAKGDAVIMLDADGQHPVEKIAEFVEKWQAGARVVVGVSSDKERTGITKRIGTKLFYTLFGRLSQQELLPGSSDYRLIDREVANVFLSLQENDRMTRSLIDWIGYERAYVHYTTKPREGGNASYSNRKLIKLATSSIVSMSPTPLYFFGYVGVFITSLSFLLGAVVFIEQILLEDPLNWNFTGTAMLAIVILFLVGIILLSQGILSLYISHINNQSKGRPLYIVDQTGSRGIKNESE